MQKKCNAYIVSTNIIAVFTLIIILGLVVFRKLVEDNNLTIKIR